MAAPAQAANVIPPGLPYVHGDKNADIAKAQRRLAWIGYDIRSEESTSGYFGRSTRHAVKEFQQKFFLDITGQINKKTWKMLAEMGGNVGVLPKACLSENVVLCVDHSAKLIRYVRKGKILTTADVRFGVPGLDTPVGDFRVYYRWEDATSGINGPDQPRAPMPYALFFNGDMAVHYSPTFAAYGYYPGGGSHGCINVGDLEKSQWIFYHTGTGTLVHIYW